MEPKRDAGLTKTRDLKGRRILVVEDEEHVRNLIVDILRWEHLEVDIAADGLKALWLLSQRPYDLVLTDLKMPTMDGPAFYREVKKLRPDTVPRMIFVTGEAYSEGYAQFLADVGAVTLGKPFTMQALQEVVAWALGTPFGLIPGGGGAGGEVTA